MTWLEELVEHAHSRLDERVLDALAGRGASEEQARLFRLGQLSGLPSTFRGLKECSTHCGICPSCFARWTHWGKRLDDVYVLPLTTTLGAVRGVQFRHLDRTRSGYMDFIVDDSEAVLFGLSQAMPHVFTSEAIFLVEGGFDLFPIQRFYPSITATLTARVVDSLLRVMRRMVKTVWMGYDTDATGTAKILEFQKYHKSEFRIHHVSYPRILLPSGKYTKDPGEVWEQWGDERFGEFIRSTVGVG